MRFKVGCTAGILLAILASANITQAQSFTAYGVSGDRLLKMGPAFPVNPVQVTGLQAEEAMVGVDYGAANDQLYVVTNQNRIYSVDRLAAVASQVGTEPFADPATYQAGAFDVIPGNGEARVITSANQNLRTSLANGQAVAVEAVLAYADGHHKASIPVIGGAAYGPDNTLYGLDENLNKLVRIGGTAGSPSPAEGSVHTIGALGSAWNNLDSTQGLSVAHQAVDGLDVGPDGSLYVAKPTTFEILFNVTTFFSVNPAKGRAEKVHSQTTHQWRIHAFTVVNDFDPQSDLDGDGVLDPDDACADTPPNTYVNEHGCTVLSPVDVTPVLVSASEKCNKKGFCKRKIQLQVLKTAAVENKTVMVSFYASIDGQVSSNDTLLGTKKAKFNKKSGIAKVNFTAKLADLGLQVIAVVDSANEIPEVNEANNTVAVPKP